MRTRPALVLSLLLAGCYMSHERGLADGERDAAVPRFDGSTFDAGARDAGSRDAGPRDAGPRDGSMRAPDASDAGFVDAMLPSVPDAGLDPGTVDGDFYTFCVRFAQVFCEGNARCCGLPDRVYDDDDYACHDWLAAGCMQGLAELPAFRDRLRVDSAAADELLRHMIRAAPGCGEIHSSHDFRALVGRVPRGGDCTPSSVPGWGELSGWERFSCEPGLRCELSGTAPDHRGRCAELGERGDSCTYDFGECEPGLYCADGPWRVGETGTGRCATRLAIGRPCYRDHDCTSLHCGREGRCEPGSASPNWCIWM